ncbi:serine/threonine-protein kinase Nek11-like [Protopterus annectens]|uniref:serine/threonine-protein kinase Nek11-like n=1 Tax=Protopterus annectens TaxID=7888 RepID=UPI001CF9AEE2|nr:serine/threonine-protein kinase Nek11-like [Protopterus annectens]
MHLSLLQFLCQSEINSNFSSVQKNLFPCFINTILNPLDFIYRSLACILYEICSLEHAFSGHSFLTVVLKIVEGETPSLPSRYSPKLNSIMQSMLHKDPSDRPSASELLKIPYIAEKLENIKSRFSNMTLKDKTINIRQDSEEIFDALQKKFHLQTLRDITEIQKMTPRERMRLRKQIAADKRAERLKMLAEAQCQENHKRKQERRARNFLHASIDVLCDGNQDHMTHSQPVTVQEYKSVGQEEVNAVKMADRMCMTEPVDQDIPDDPIEAETYYYEDNFDSCNETSTEEDEENEDKEMDDLTMQTIFKTCQQGSDVNALIRCMEGILDGTSLGSETVTSMSPAVSMGPSTINNAMAEMKLQRMKESAIEKLGKDVFNKVYEYLKKARQKNLNEMVVKEYLGRIVSKPSDCFEVDQLLYYEEQLRTPH